MLRVPTRMSGAAALVACLWALGGAASAQGKDCRGADGQPRGHQAARATLCLLNQQRRAAGLAPLKRNRSLRRAAKQHSRDMVANRYFDHDSPIGSTLVLRVTANGYVRGADAFEVRENLGWGVGTLATPRAVVAAWLASPGHRANLLCPTMHHAGIGIAQGSPFGGPGATYTVDFGSRH